MNEVEPNIVLDNEDVARLVCPEWIEDGILLDAAFALAPKETYLSVMRPIIPTYHEDANNFIKKHKHFSIDGKTYSRAMLNVNKIRNIKIVSDGDEELNIDVVVEPRNAQTKSHAGIIVKTNEEYIVRGRGILNKSIPVGISADDILQEIQFKLNGIAKLERCVMT